MDCDAVSKSGVKRWYTLDLILFGGFAVAYAGFWGINLLTSYLDGLSNGGCWLLGLLGSCGLGILLVVWFFALLVRMLTAWLTHIHSWRRLVLLCTLTIIALAAWVALPFLGLWPSGCGTFMPGFRRYMQVNADLGAIRNWLSTVDANACAGVDINLYVGKDLTSHWPSTMAWPEAITRFDPHYVQLSKTDAGRVTVRLTWGGALGHWGIEVGPEDMPIPETVERTREEYGPPDHRQVLYTPGEYRLPLAPGAYVWHEIQ